MPTPGPDEKRAEFLARCMADPDSQSNFPQIEERHAYCVLQWEGPEEQEREATDSACGCGHVHAHDAPRRPRSPDGDPTGTGPIVRRWEAEARRRFSALRREVVRAVVERDVLGLRGPTLDSATFQRVWTDALPDEREFAFESNPRKVQAFRAWLDAQARAGVLGVQEGTPQAVAADESWQNVYVDGAYRKGIRDAYDNIEEAGGEAPSRSVSAGFGQPIHADAVGIIYSRAYEALEGVTEAMSQQMGEVLALGLAEGMGPMEIARLLAARVDSIGTARARTIARTETIAAHAEASLNSYEQAGLLGVRVVAEWSTAGDDAVCPDCADLEGRTFDISEARGMIPLHPNCRCAFIPVVEDPE